MPIHPSKKPSRHFLSACLAASIKHLIWEQYSFAVNNEIEAPLAIGVVFQDYQVRYVKNPIDPFTHGTPDIAEVGATITLVHTRYTVCEHYKDRDILRRFDGRWAAFIDRKYKPLVSARIPDTASFQNHLMLSSTFGALAPAMLVVYTEGRGSRIDTHVVMRARRVCRPFSSANSFHRVPPSRGKRPARQHPHPAAQRPRSRSEDRVDAFDSASVARAANKHALSPCQPAESISPA